ncbi:MAG: hypothetical protein ACYC64_19115 [Armatimonadota bacterium]
MHKRGLIDGICSGIHYSTADIARPAIKVLGVKDGVKNGLVGDHSRGASVEEIITFIAFISAQVSVDKGGAQ